MKILHLYRSYDGKGRAGIYYILKKFLEIQNDHIQNDLLITYDKNQINFLKQNLKNIYATKSFGTLFSMPMSPNYLFRAIKLSKNYDAVIAHTPFPFANLCLIFLGNKKKKYIFWHADIIKNRFLKFLLNPLISLSLKKADKIFVGHPMIIETNKKLLNYKFKCHTLPFPIDLTPYDSNQVEKDLSIVSCGRLVKYKGFDDLIDAAQYIDSEVIIIGDGPEKKFLLEKRNNLNLTDKIKFTGEIDENEKINYLKRSKIFALSSNTEQETFGIVQLEAMAAGCAIVNTKINTAVPHIATHGREALTAEPNNPKDFAEKLNMLLNDDSLRKKLGDGGHARVKSLYSDQTFYSKFLEIINQ